MISLDAKKAFARFISDELIYRNSKKGSVKAAEIRRFRHVKLQ
jgi:hypothetical protein